MNQGLWAVFLLTTLVGTLWGSTVYGEATTKPLWVAGVVPTVAVGTIIFGLFAANVRSRQWESALMIVGGYLIAGPIVLGLLSYVAARRARGAKPKF